MSEDKSETLGTTSKWKEYLLELMQAYFWAFNLSCGVNLQQNGYRQHNDFFSILGVTLIAVSLVGFRKSGKL